MSGERFSYWHAWASIVKGWALVELGERDAGLEMLNDDLDRYAATGAAQMRSYALCLQAEAYQHAGLWPKSALAAREAIVEAERTGMTFYLAGSIPPIWRGPLSPSPDEDGRRANAYTGGARCGKTAFIFIAAASVSVAPGSE